MELQVRTAGRVELTDITARIQEVVTHSGLREGMVHLFVLHTTAGITINENADPDVVSDLLSGLERMVPATAPYRHAEGNSPAHLKASLMGFSLQVPVASGRLALGTWQGIYLCEFDGPRTRRLRITLFPAPPQAPEPEEGT